MRVSTLCLAILAVELLLIEQGAVLELADIDDWVFHLAGALRRDFSPCLETIVHGRCLFGGTLKGVKHLYVLTI